MSKQKKKRRQTNSRPFVNKIENFIVQYPSLPSLDKADEIKVEKQQKVIKILILVIIIMLVFICYHSSVVQMYMANWDIIEPISQLIEWVLILVMFIAYKYI